MFDRLFRQFRYFRSHPLTKDQPWDAFARYISWQIRSRITREITFNWVEDSKLLVRRGMTGATGNIYCGLHEFADMAFVLHFLKQGELFGDIGANIGSYSILASVACGANVLAVEPDEQAASRLRLNAELNKKTSAIELCQTAVGENEGTISFTLGLDTMNRVSEGGADGSVQTVNLSTLDRLFGRRTPVMMKLDVEGFELQVLKGSQRLLASQDLMAIQSECQEPEVLALLKASGFEEWHYDPFSRELTAKAVIPHSNGLFIRRIEEVRERLATAKRFRILQYSI